MSKIYHGSFEVVETDHRLNAHSQSVIHWKIAAYKLT